MLDLRKPFVRLLAFFFVLAFHFLGCTCDAMYMAGTWFGWGRPLNVEYNGFCSRLGGAICGMVFGLIMFAGSLALLGWNEGRAVHTERAIQDGRKVYVNAPCSPVNPTLEGQLVHLTCRVSTPQPLVDPTFSISAKSIQLVRTVEMYQYREHKQTQQVVFCTPPSLRQLRRGTFFESHSVCAWAHETAALLRHSVGSAAKHFAAQVFSLPVFAFTRLPLVCVSFSLFPFLLQGRVACRGARSIACLLDDC